MAKRRKGVKLVEDPLSSDCYPVRNNANARERSRMRVLSKAFTVLKTTLPWVPPDTKLSKLDTLRLATCYIAHLRKILAEDSDDPSEEPAGNDSAHPLTLTWPYSIASRPVGQTAQTPKQHKPPHTSMPLLQRPKTEMDVSPVS